MDIENYIGMAEAARISGMSIFHLSRLCRQGKIEGAVKVSQNWLAPRSSVENYTPGPKGFAAHPRKKSAIPPEWEQVIPAISSQRHVEPPRRQRRKKQDTGA